MSVMTVEEPSLGEILKTARGGRMELVPDGPGDRVRFAAVLIVSLYLISYAARC